MAESKSHPKNIHSVGKNKYTLVQGADGTYFLVSPDPGEKTIEIKDQEGLLQFLKDLNRQLSDYLGDRQKNMTAGSGVHIGTADIFPD